MGALSPQQVMRLLTIVIAVIVPSATSVPSFATGSPSNAELREAIKALETRVAALEAQLQQKADTQQEASIPKPTLVALAEQAPAYSPMRLGNQPQPLPQPNNGWSGLYVGTSFGVGSAKSSSRYRSVSHHHDEDTSEDTDVDVEDDGSIDINSNSNTGFSDETSFVKGLTSDDETDGALADLYLGGTRDLPLELLRVYRSKAR